MHILPAALVAPLINSWGWWVGLCGEFFGSKSPYWALCLLSLVCAGLVLVIQKQLGQTGKSRRRRSKTVLASSIAVSRPRRRRKSVERFEEYQYLADPRVATRSTRRKSTSSAAGSEVSAVTTTKSRRSTTRKTASSDSKASATPKKATRTPRASRAKSPSTASKRASKASSSASTASSRTKSPKPRRATRAKAATPAPSSRRLRTRSRTPVSSK